jgi:hypothetical protein
VSHKIVGESQNPHPSKRRMRHPKDSRECDLHRVHRGVDIGQKILLERLDIYGEHGRIGNGSALPKSAGRAGDSQSGLSYSKE